MAGLNKEEYIMDLFAKLQAEAQTADAPVAVSDGRPGAASLPAAPAKGDAP